MLKNIKHSVQSQESSITLSLILFLCA